MDVTASPSIDTIEEVRKLNKDKTNKGQAEKIDKVQKKLDVPPEYDEFDSRWTLKYREPAEGLVELMDYSGVYVNAEKLAECENLSSDSNRLAQLLLTEIFTISALSTCTWSGIKDKDTDIDGGYAAPELDAHAKNTLLKFVNVHAQTHGWELMDCHCIVKNLRRLMLQMRLKKYEPPNYDLNDSRWTLKYPEPAPGHIELMERSRVSPNYDPNDSRWTLKYPEPAPGHIELMERSCVSPNYDPNDSRWTLKYREPAPGLVELMKHSRVYISIEKLGKCLTLSKDCVTLARMLLSEIFTASALSKCSVTYLTVVNIKQSDTNITPVLDVNALLTLLTFTTGYGRENNWWMASDELRFIQDSIRQKMEIMRRVQRKTMKENDRDKFLKKNCSLEITSVPPKYDANDSRWTLRYREPAEGLVELMEHSGVYVNADKLTECKEVSKDCVALAEKLLTEVFTTSALATCSLSVENSEFYDSYGLQQRCCPKPELDAYAENILLNNVDEYGLEQGWPVLDFRFIKKYMADIMCQMEQQYALKQTELELPALNNLTITDENSLP